MLRVQPTLTALTPVSRWLHLRILRAFDTRFGDFVFNRVEAASWPKVAPPAPQPSVPHPPFWPRDLPQTHCPLSPVTSNPPFLQEAQTPSLKGGVQKPRARRGLAPFY